MVIMNAALASTRAACAVQCIQRCRATPTVSSRISAQRDLIRGHFKLNENLRPGAFTRNARWPSKQSLRICATGSSEDLEAEAAPSSAPAVPKPSSAEVDSFARKTAATFAPRASTKTKNPATRGTLLYAIFTWQAWLSLVAGGLLSFNLLLPSDEPNVARLLGMWSIWVFVVPSLRARDCSAKEKDVLNYLFLLIPLINVTVPLFWRSFGAVFAADVVAMAAIYAYKGVLPWAEPDMEVSENANK
eukprot:jgi/Mesvir1/10775/Mv13835-RA.1